MLRYITTHTSTGQASFVDQNLSGPLPLSPPNLSIPIGQIQMLFSSRTRHPDVSLDKDLDQYAEDKARHFFPGPHRICPEDGSCVCIITMSPGAVSDMHRTSTLDVVVVLEGTIQIHLENGESRTLETGDSVVQRGTIHRWVNVTPDNGIARWIAFIQAAEGLDKIAGNDEE